MDSRSSGKPIIFDQSTLEMSEQDLAQIFNYPAIGELFKGNDTKDLDNFTARLNAIRNDLERIVRSGSRTEADGAERAIKGIEVTLEFLQTLQKMRS